MYFTGFQGDAKLLYGTEHHRALTLIKKIRVPQTILEVKKYFNAMCNAAFATGL